MILGMIYGLRRSEVAGLKWSGIDFKNNSLIVERTMTRFSTVVEKETTKNESSNRTLPLNQEVKSFLLRQRAAQSENKLRMGRSYQDTDYVCRWPDGHGVSCSNISSKFKVFLSANGIPANVRFHDLRHSCASYLLRAGCSMKEIADWHGHADIGAAMNIYTHLDKRDQTESR